jgi:hypothetical protein
MPYGTVNTDIVADSSGGKLAPISSVFRNRIINGAMVIDQRNAGASVTASTTGSYVYTLDRWRYYATAASKYTIQQNAGSVTPPVGFTNYLGVTSSSAYSVGSGDTFFISQVIEGYNIADLGWGTANAKTVTLSFQVYSSLTGTFGGSLRNVDTPNRSYPFNYTISSANTWTTISVTIAGDTTGTWNTTNGQGIQVQWNLGSGSTFSGTANSWQAGNFIAPTGATSVVGTNGATFYITGVQLEVGSSATGFEYVNYQTSLANCQRYYWKIKAPSTSGGVRNMFGIGATYDSSESITILQFPVTMRTDPTALEQSGTAGDYAVISGSSVQTCTSVPAFNSANTNGASFSLLSSGNLTAGGRATVGRSLSTNAYLAWSAEL